MITIRPLELWDKDQLIDIIREFVQYERDAFDPTSSVEHTYSDIFLERIDKKFEDNPDSQHYVAIDDESWVLAGYIYGIVMDYPSRNIGWGKMSYLLNLYIKEEYRAHWLWKKLFTQYKDRAKEQWATRLKLHCLKWNDPAKGFYEKMGFEVYDYTLEQSV